MLVVILLLVVKENVRMVDLELFLGNGASNVDDSPRKSRGQIACL